MTTASNKPESDVARTERGMPSNERMTEIIGVMAHQVRNPLGSIKNAAYLLNLSLGENASPDVTQSIAIIHDEVKRANEIITGLVDLVRIRPPRVRATSIAYVVEQSLGGQTLTGERKLSADLADDLQAQIDPDQTQQAIFHLCRHALASIAPGGTLAVRAVRADDHAVVTLVDRQFEQCDPEFDAILASHPPELSMALLTARVLLENQNGSCAIDRRGRSISIVVRLPLKDCRSM